ncbi:hypothetical protein M758_6G031900 [Ceratodon purpureus]|uniref:Uncharacterized protein n=1 Tax=Ceratodon purpureus TaxID=3225 RepID=A0A8T0HDA2_CERPU|nr:hypothetical protein KC19_6G034900 [Ceratodon purpureus]KAG0612490.1 hypothetical protein M758_6G031900 [Ceratodon purpureus]
MELDWYSKRQFSSNSARRVATLTNFMGHVGSRLLFVKPLYKRFSSTISLRSLPATSKEWDDYDDFLDFQPKCMSFGRSTKWMFSQFDMSLRRKHHVNCFACVLHI